MNECRQHDKCYAALDLGTNNCRLLIAHPRIQASTGRSLTVLDSYSRVVRLGEGIIINGQLSKSAIDRTKESLRHCAEKLEKYNITRSRFVATEACRRANNTADFIEEVRHDIGLELEVISTEEEARLALMGCCSLLERGVHHALAFDIGGGSTEVMWAETPNPNHNLDDPLLPVTPAIRGWLSLPYGVMSLSETIPNTAYAELFFDEIVERLMHHLIPMSKHHNIQHWLQQDHTQLLSTSGTVTTLAAIYLGLHRYDRARVDGVKLAVKDLQKTIRHIIQMRPSERFMHPCIGPDRCEFILAGCAIFEAIVRTFPFHFITIADRGVREGVIMGLVAQEARATLN
ncbi:MAG: Ppx/GppA family phosphatase [Alphaproteobacteria bacterium]|nr:MAG: Ppx/GppA family phosphatase [Alphaproteobacteria bacterium]TAF76514.1 MAG: Ppx/GppA family phosphatase [Alphaproteobacteria bacterium]